MHSEMEQPQSERAATLHRVCDVQAAIDSLDRRIASLDDTDTIGLRPQSGDASTLLVSIVACVG